MFKNKIVIFIFIVFVLGVALMFLRGSEDTWICREGEWIKHGVPYAPKPTEPCGEKADLIRLDSPRPNQIIESPLVISGEARGYWFFEGDFPVVLTDWDGLIIAEGIARTEDGWMTEDFVRFYGTLEFEKPSFGATGSLILQKDNPSGLPENDDALEIPIKFE